MNARLPLAAVLLSGGCWPYIPGSYDDYTTPENVRVVGRAVLDEYLGGYWAGNADPHGSVWLAWLPEPLRDFKALELASNADTGCAAGVPERSDFSDLFGDPGANSATLIGPEGDLSLPWIPGSSIFGSDVDSLPIGQYDLDALDTDEGGTLRAQTVLRVPKPADIAGVALDDDEPATISLDQLDFAWNSAEELAQYVIISVALLDDQDEILENAACSAKFGAGELSVPLDVWELPGRASSAIIALSTANEQWVEIGDRGFAARTLSERRTLGAVLLD